MTNHDGIVSDLREHKLSYLKIAEKHGCNPRTVFIDAQRFGLQYGRGTKNWWQFDQLSPELSYLMGAYITDGTITKEYKTGNLTGINISSTTSEYLEYIRKCISCIGLVPHECSRGPTDTIRWGNKPQHAVAAYSRMFAKWIYDQCDQKSKIPQIIFNATEQNKINFVAGAIDGDGSVDKEGCIRIREIDKWLFDLPALLRTIGIRCSDCRLVEVLPSGKLYNGLSIRRSDYVKHGGFCVIPFKQDRLMNAKIIRP